MPENTVDAVAEHTLQPTIFVGLGGFAKNVLLRTREKLIHQYGSLGALPSIRFLHIDTDVDKSLPQLTPGAGFEKSERIELSEKLRGVSPDKVRNTRNISAWFETRYPLQGLDFTKGASGMRMLGRLAISHSMETFRAEMISLFSEVKHIGNRATTARTLKVVGLREEPQVIVVSSLVGGTGSGTFIDACYNIRQVAPSVEIVGHFVIGHENANTRQQLNYFAGLLDLNYYMTPYEIRQRPFVGGYTCDESASFVKNTATPVNTAFILNSTNRHGITYQRNELEHLMAQNLCMEFVPGVVHERASRRIDITGSSEFLAMDMLAHSPTDCRPQNFLTYGLSMLQFPSDAVKNCLAARFAADVVEHLRYKNAPPLMTTAHEKLINDLKLDRVEHLIDAIIRFGESTAILPSLINAVQKQMDEQSGNIGKKTAAELISDIEIAVDSDQREFDAEQDPRYRGETLNRLKDRTAQLMVELREVLVKELADLATKGFAGPRNAAGMLQFVQQRCDTLRPVLEKNRKDAESRKSALKKTLLEKKALLINNIKKGDGETFLRDCYTDLSLARQNYYKGNVTAAAMGLAINIIGFAQDPKGDKDIYSLVALLRQDLHLYAGSEELGVGADKLSKLQNELQDMRTRLMGQLVGHGAQSGMLALDAAELDELYSWTDAEGKRRAFEKEHFEALAEQLRVAVLQEEGFRKPLFWATLRDSGVAGFIHRLACTRFEFVGNVSVAEKLLKMPPDKRQQLLEEHFRRSGYLLPETERNAQVVSNLNNDPTMTHKRYIMMCDPHDDPAVTQLTEFINTFLPQGFVINNRLRHADRDKVIFLEEMGVYPLYCLKPTHGGYRESYLRYRDTSQQDYDARVMHHLDKRLYPMPDFFAGISKHAYAEISDRVLKYTAIGRSLGIITLAPTVDQRGDLVTIIYTGKYGQTEKRQLNTDSFNDALELIRNEEICRASSPLEALEKTALGLLSEIVDERFRNLNVAQAKELGAQVGAFLSKSAGEYASGPDDPRFQQIVRLVGDYSEERGVKIALTQPSPDAADVPVPAAAMPQPIPQCKYSEAVAQARKIMANVKVLEVDKPKRIREYATAFCGLSQTEAERVVTEVQRAPITEAIPQYRNAWESIIAGDELTLEHRSYLESLSKQLNLERAQCEEVELAWSYSRYREMVASVLAAGSGISDEHRTILEKHNEVLMLSSENRARAEMEAQTLN